MGNSRHTDNARSFKSKHTAETLQGHTPGPYEEAALRIYYERGSKEVIDKNAWRWLSFVEAIALVLCAIAFWQLIPLKSVETALISKTGDNRAAVEFAGGTWNPDTDMQAAWVNDWVQQMTEVNAATWERSIARVVQLTVGTGRDQVRDYLRRDENSPAGLLHDKPMYIREYRRTSVNSIGEKNILLRYSLTSRPTAGERAIVKNYAITVNMVRVKPDTREQVLFNPTGLSVSNFSIAEDSTQ